MKRKVKNSKGFTLVETVAAITILTLVVAAVTASLIASIRFNAKTEQRLQAELAVSNAVERLMAEVVYDPADLPDWYDPTDPHGVHISDEADTFDPDGTLDSGDEYVIGYDVTVKSNSINTISVTAYIPAEEAP